MEPEPFPRQVDLVDEQVIRDHAAEQPASVILPADGLAELDVELVQHTDTHQEAGQVGRQPVHDLVGQVVARLLRRRGQGVDHLARIASGTHRQHGHLHPGRPALREGAEPPAIDGFASQARQLKQLLDLDVGERKIAGAQLCDHACQPEPGRGEHGVVLAGHQQTDMGQQMLGKTYQRAL